MTETCRNLGVQSYCFRAVEEHAKVAALVRELGLDAVELCRVHVDFSAPDTFEDIVKTYENAGVRIVAIGVQTMRNRPDLEEIFFEFTQRAGCRFMSVDFDISTTPDSYEAAIVLAEKYDIHLALHNHGGAHWLGNAASIAHLFSQTSPRIGLCLDTAWALQAHEDPLAMVGRFGERLYGVHIKDFVFDRSGTPTDVVVGEGNLDLGRLQTVLSDVEFEGYIVLEYEGDVHDPVPALKNCVAAVREHMV